jgi:protein TonB
VIDRRLVVCAAASVIGHLVTGEALEQLPARAHVPRVREVAVRVVTAEPPPPLPEPPPEPPKPEPEPPKPPPPKPEPVRKAPDKAPTKPVDPATPPPATPAPATTTDPSAPPVFGVSMESTSPTGSGPSMPVGSSSAPQGSRPAAPPADKTVSGAPVAAADVTKMPLPQGRCAGAYTEAARAAGLEGVVVLDLVVDETGRARNIKVVEGLGHGLSEAAVRALEACRFTPGERDGVKVSVRVRSFKIRFLLQEGN